jgi:hypothetical protein
MSPGDKPMNRKAQSILEYTCFVALVAAALMAMTVYAKRALQGRMRGYVSQISDEAYYSPGATISDNRITRNVNEVSHSDSMGIEDDAPAKSDNTATIVQSTTKSETVNDDTQIQ